jgi:uncharacterized membrane protein (UPF0127 family)
MKFEIIILSGIIIVFFIILYFKRSPTKYTTVEIKDTKIRAEVADTLTKRTIGLMSKKTLPENEGMLFIFDDEGLHSFWMMNMSFPIDIIWVNREKKVVDITKNAQPCKLNCSVYRPKEKVIYVLEVNAKFAEEHGVTTGSSVKFELQP